MPPSQRTTLFRPLPRLRWRVGIFLFVGAAAAAVSQGAIPASEREALIALYVSTRGVDWYRTDNWFGAVGTEETWFGVKVLGDHVVEINLEGNNLRGPVPPEIGNLLYLRRLDLSIEQSGTAREVPGVVPTFWIPRLNRISSLPGEVGKLDSLQILDLYGNELASLPPEIGDLQSLWTLSLGDNRLSELVPEIGGLTTLEALNLSENSLSFLPPQIGNLVRLQTLSLSENDLTSLPEELGNLRSLQSLHASDNQLVSLPESLGNLTALVELYLGNNLLTELPSSIGDLEALRDLWLGWNELTGLPATLGQLSNLSRLEITRNRLQELPSSIEDLDALVTLRLSFNDLSSLPPAIGGLARLESLLLDHCRLTSLPAEIGDLESLRELSLEDNQLESVPAEIGRLASLTSLDLSRNRLAGPIPVELGDLRNLVYLHFSENALSGEIPPEMGKLSQLRNFVASHNDLSGPIPKELVSIPRLLSLWLDHNQLTGPIPLELERRLELKSLNLSCNHLTGEIPGLERLILGTLDLSQNRLTGTLPPTLITYYGYFAGNQLSGEIPAELCRSEDLRWNALWAGTEEVRACLENNHRIDNFEATQTVSPTDVRVERVAGNHVTLAWTPILYTGDSGGYEIFASETADGPYRLAGRTPNKSASSRTASGLDVDTEYFFKVRTVTFPHENNQNTVTSGFSETVSSRTDPTARFGFPLMSLGPDRFTGLAVSNAGDRAANVEFRAYDEDGRLLQAGCNPAAFVLEPHAQLAGLGWEIFGLEPDTSVVTWVELAADSSRLGSLLLLGTGEQLDGTRAFSVPETRLFFTRVAPLLTDHPASTWLVLVNPNDEAAGLELTLHGASEGDSETETTATTRALPPKGFIRASVEELFGPAARLEPTYLEVTVTEGPGIFGWQTIELENRGTLIALDAQAASGSDRLYSAQLADGPEIFTRIELVNTTPEARSVTLRAVGADGSLLADPVVRALPGGGVLEEDSGDLFGFEDSLTVGSLEVDCPGGGILGDVVFGQRGTLAYAAALALQSEPFTRAWFSQVANTDRIFTGLAFYNPGAEPVEVTVEVLSEAGTPTGTRSFQLAAGARVSQLLSELVPETAGQVRGSVVIRSSGPIVGQQLFGDFTHSYLSAVPPAGR